MDKNKFEQMVEARKQTERSPEPNIGGSFDCQTCDECVDGAFLDRSTGMMVWKCSAGHTSFISDVGI